MKWYFSLLMVLTCYSSLAQPQLTGTWKGKIAAFNLTVVFNLAEKNNKLVATMDSPDQGAKDIPCDNVVVSGNVISIGVSVIGGSFTGTLSDDHTTINGKWKQGGGSFDLLLGKNVVPPPKAKPQTPQPPFPYTTEDVAYDNNDKTVHLAGTLSYPATLGKKFPAAILISGSGQQDRDETLMGHKPFAVIADRLTRLGFAVLRVDDRGTGQSVGEVMHATSADFANDVITSLAYLKQRKEIDTSRIGLIGHSEGGLIASIVAAGRNDISFMILLAGPGMKGAGLLAEQAEQILLSTGIPENAVQNYMPFYRKILDLSAAGTDSASLAMLVKQEFHAWKSASPPELVKQAGFTDISHSEGILNNLIQGFSGKWMQYFLASDAGALLEKTSARVLALNGEKDIQVIAASNTNGIKMALQKSRSPLYEVTILPGLNHLFQQCNTCTIAEYGMLEESFSESALKVMDQWLQQNILQL